MKDYVKALLITHFLTYVTIVFDIPILRQVVCFFYLTFVPGFLVLKVLKLESKMIDIILFSVGLIDHIVGAYPESWSLDKERKKCRTT